MLKSNKHGSVSGPDVFKNCKATPQQAFGYRSFGVYGSSRGQEFSRSQSRGGLLPMSLACLLDF